MDSPDLQIPVRLDSVKQRIEAAALASGRNRDAVKLVVISKYVDADRMRLVLQSGHSCFGENYVQEALEKRTRLDDPDIEWHLTGHLQSNKAKLVPGNFSWLHTLDSLELARRLDRKAAELSVTLNVLLQVNISADPAKQGLARDAVYGFTESLLEAAFPAIRLRGLMTIGRAYPDPAARRADFAALRQLGEACAVRFGSDHFDELSMGMSDDFETAIAEGATQVRIGSAIFGPRTTGTRHMRG